MAGKIAACSHLGDEVVEVTLQEWGEASLCVVVIFLIFVVVILSLFCLFFLSRYIFPFTESQTSYGD